VVGIGHELRGDDAAGVAVVRALGRAEARRSRRGNPRPPAARSLLVIDAGPAPENCTAALRRFGPDLVLLIDAAEFGAPPGTVCWLDWRSAAGLSASTHTLPCSLLARYLIAELGCRVMLLGIQPADTTIGASLSPAVRRAAQTVARRLAAQLG
jgi:hydrogenase 3 maturation protease